MSNDIRSRWAAIQSKREQDAQNPIMASVRRQVRSIVETIHPKPTAERNREGYIEAMAAKGAPVYGGTVSPKVKAKRRAANRAARQSRRANR